MEPWSVDEDDLRILARQNSQDARAGGLRLWGDNGDLLTQEEMVISNVDSMSFVFLERVADMIGVYNVTPSTLDLIELRLEGTIEYFYEVRIERIGGQLIDAVGYRSLVPVAAAWQLVGLALLQSVTPPRAGAVGRDG